MKKGTKQSLLLIFGIFIASRIVVWLLNNHIVLLIDSGIYLDTANAIKHGNTLKGFLGKNSYLVSPLYPYLLLLLDHWQLSFQSLAWVQTIFSFFCGILIYAIAAEQIGEIPAILVSAFFWVCPAILFFEYAVMTEILFSFFFLLAIYSLFKIQNQEFASRRMAWIMFLFSLFGLIETKPLGKIFTLLLILCLAVLNSSLIVMWIQRHRPAFLICGFLGLGLAAILRLNTVHSTESIGWPGVLGPSLAPILDMTYPPIQSNSALSSKLTPGIQHAHLESTTLFGYQVPPNNAGLSYINFNCTNENGLINVIYNKGESITDPDKFLGGWIIYSIEQKPLGFLLFMGKQVYNGVVMLSGAFLDHAPDFYLGHILYLKRPILSGELGPIMDGRSKTERELNPAFKTYYANLFEVIRFKRWLMFLFRGLFGLMTLFFGFRCLKAISKKRFMEFTREEYFSVGIIMFFYLYTSALALTSAPLGRYYVMLFSLCMVFVIKETMIFFAAFL